MSNSPYVKAGASKLAYINRLAEARLEAQLKLGIAADQRAMTMASILSVADAAIISFLASKGGATLDWSFVSLLVGFAISAGLAAWSAIPIAWEIPGSEPSNWLEDIDDQDTLLNGKAAMAEFYDEMITQNDERLSMNATSMRAAFIMMIMALIISGFLALLGL